jgi:hypothetical protein
MAYDDPGADPAMGGGGGAGGGGIAPCPPGTKWYSPSRECVPKCPQGQTWDPEINSCRSRSGSVSGDLTAGCPPGETREQSSAICRCPEGQCRDINSKACRPPRRNEKVNETDDIERATGGGRGYCRPLDPGQVPTGGGGGGGGGASGMGGASGNFGIGGGAGLSTMFDAQAKSIWDNLAPIMSGQQTRYSPEVMARLDANAKAASRGEARAGRDAVLRDAITRKVGRSGIASRGIANVERQAVTDYTQTSNQNQIEKVRADFGDRMAALDAAEKWLAQMQSYVATLDQTAAGREKAIAEIALGYARIKADRDNLEKRLQTDILIANGNNANQLEIARRGLLSDLFR